LLKKKLSLRFLFKVSILESLFLRLFHQKKNATMGKGDKRTKRGKIILGSHGVTRPKTTKKIAPKTAA
jgi:ribosomal small subunit protein bTHX